MKSYSVALKRLLYTAFFLLLIYNVNCLAQGDIEMSAKWDELTAPEFIEAVALSGKTCIIPLGIMEKHGAHLPLGTDLLIAREIASRAAEKEYCLVFPPYYVGQIFEAMHQPGTVAYSNELIWNMLQETCDELHRNGIEKIILVNGHGGNNSFLPYFCQSQLTERKDYAVVFFQPETDEATMREIARLKKTGPDMHAGEEESSMVAVIRPELVYPERAASQSGEDRARLSVPYGYTGIWWYARFPNHYAGDGSHVDKKIGELLLESRTGQLVELIRYLKENNDILELQDRFYKEAIEPLKPEQK
jgi:creatinine amidohydrolase